jgi:hypothetical protein
MSTPAVSLTPTLFEQYYIFRPPNPWSEVQAARDKLRGLQVAYKGMEKDRDKVVAYVNVLRRSGRVLAAATCVAAHLGRYSPAPSAELGFMDGLAALSGGLGLQYLDESARIAEIDRCFHDLSLQQRDPPDLDISEDLSTNNSMRWRETLNSLLRDVNLADKPLSNEDAQREAWAAWESRLQFLRQGGALPPVDINYLRCVAAGLLAGRILPARADAITLCAASDALTTALAPNSKDPAPDTFAAGLLAALGFDLSPELLSKGPDLSLAQFLTRAASANPQPTARGLLVFRLPAGSQTAAWRIDPSAPTLDIVPDRAQDLFNGKLNLTRYLTSRLQAALFEIDMSQSITNEIGRCTQLRRIIAAYLPNLRLVLLVPRPITNLTGIPAEWQHPVLSPLNQADAARQLSSQAVTT